MRPLRPERGWSTKAGRAKYLNKKVIADGVLFDSKAERARYEQLKIMERAGLISELELQPEFLLQPAFEDIDGKAHRAIKYRADFRYFDLQLGRTVVEDVKGLATKEFAIKQKLLLHQRHNFLFRVLSVKT